MLRVGAVDERFFELAIEPLHPQPQCTV